MGTAEEKEGEGDTVVHDLSVLLLGFKLCFNLKALEEGVSSPWPLFSGETSQEEWKRRLQENPGPWGELATDNIILTVPTANLRTLENPEPLLRLWDEVMQAVARLGAEPFPLRLPQRIVADVQISVGGCPGRRALCARCPRGTSLLPAACSGQPSG